MRKIVTHSLSIALLAALFLTNCNNNSGEDELPAELSGLNLIAMSESNGETEITNINLGSGLETRFDIDCMVLSSRVYDQATKSFGYTACDQTFRMVSLATGEQISSYALPGNISMAVINDREHVLIGTYYDQAAQRNHVIRLDLDNGTLLSDLIVEELGPMYTCTQFFNQEQQTFHLISDQNKILTIDAINGNVTGSVDINSGTNITHFDEPSGMLYSITYDRAIETNYIEHTIVATGELVKRVEVLSQSNYRLCVTDFDPATNSIVTVNSDNEVRYVNVDTGELVDTVPFDIEKTPVTFWQ